MNNLLAHFTRPKPVIGMIALTPSPGYPRFTTPTALIDHALTDLYTLQRGGVDGVCVENDFDHPHTLTAGPEVIAMMTAVVREIVRAAAVPVGVEVLLNDPYASLAVALAAGARFIRTDFFVDDVRISAGEVHPHAAGIVGFRHRINAGHLCICADVQVKYSTLLTPGKTLAQSTAQAVAAGADAVIVTGTATGTAPTLADVRAVKEAAGHTPVFIGSGTTPANAAALLAIADGAIVGSALKAAYEPGVPVDEHRVRALMASLGG